MHICCMILYGVNVCSYIIRTYIMLLALGLSLLCSIVLFRISPEFCAYYAEFYVLLHSIMPWSDYNNVQ